MTETGRFYGDLARWWPLISPVDDYSDEAAGYAAILDAASIPVHDVLELGSGGGHNAAHLGTRFELTLVDLSPAMLAESRRLNPECVHHVGDMRTVRLGESFDAVFVHDAVDYLLSVDDLGAAITTAFVHCRPGGRVLFAPDHTSETYADSTDHGGADAPDGRGARLFEWTWDPDPTDSMVRTDYVFLLRDADGTVHSHHETHEYGLFSTDTWLALISSAGFHASAVDESTDDDRTPRTLFVGDRPR